MCYSIWLLAASCLSGTAGDNVIRCDSAAPASAPAGYVICEQPCGEHEEHCGFLSRLFSRLGMFSSHRQCEYCGECYVPHARSCHCCLTLRQRLARLFCRRCHCCSCCTCGCNSTCRVESVMVQPAPAPAPETAPPPRPVKETVQAPKVIVRPVALTPPAPTEISPEYLPRVGNAPDYSWVTGQLFYIHAEGGMWIVRYAPVDREDRYGGSLVLAPAVNMDSFHEGDLVTVHGEMLVEGRAKKYAGGPLYRALDVRLEDRKSRR